MRTTYQHTPAPVKTLLRALCYSNVMMSIIPLRGLNTAGVIRFLKYSAVGVSTFAFDLVLLFVLTDFLHIQYIVSTGIAFILAVSVNYFLSRALVFKGTLRSVHAGYAIFIIIAASGLLIVTGSMFVLVGLNYLVSRVLIAGIVGVWNYLLNLYVNFKVAGQ